MDVKLPGLATRSPCLVLASAFTLRPPCVWAHIPSFQENARHPTLRTHLKPGRYYLIPPQTLFPNGSLSSSVLLPEGTLETVRPEMLPFQIQEPSVGVSRSRVYWEPVPPRGAIPVSPQARWANIPQPSPLIRTPDAINEASPSQPNAFWITVLKTVTLGIQCQCGFGKAVIETASTWAWIL